MAYATPKTYTPPTAHAEPAIAEYTYWLKCAEWWMRLKALTSTMPSHYANAVDDEAQIQRCIANAERAL